MLAKLVRPDFLSSNGFTMKNIVIFSTYFGEWPTWLPAFLLSCEKNDSIQWVCFTDCEIPDISA
ncbi:MAG: hypothetical protein PVG98_14335, partial [Chromatiales bacterium]